MKITAKEATVGMTIVWGVTTITIKEIKILSQKNGTELRKFYGPAVRSFGKGVRPQKYNDYDVCMKAETTIRVK